MRNALSLAAMIPNSSSDVSPITALRTKRTRIITHATPSSRLKPSSRDRAASKHPEQAIKRDQGKLRWIIEGNLYELRERLTTIGGIRHRPIPFTPEENELIQNRDSSNRENHFQGRALTAELQSWRPLSRRRRAPTSGDAVLGSSRKEGLQAKHFLNHRLRRVREWALLEMRRAELDARKHGRREDEIG
jgi:hypothetical protein